MGRFHQNLLTKAFFFDQAFSKVPSDARSCAATARLQRLFRATAGRQPRVSSHFNGCERVFTGMGRLPIAQQCSPRKSVQNAQKAQKAQITHRYSAQRCYKSF